MLNFFRQKRDKIKWVLWLVIIGLAAGMVLLFVATPTGNEGDVANFAAKVGGREISPVELRVAMRQIEARGVAQGAQVAGYALSQLVSQEVAIQYAEKYGLGVSDDEIRDAVAKVFVDDAGKFIGYDKYKEILATNSVTPEMFEEDTRKQLLIQKFSDLVSGSVFVSDKEVEDQFKENGDKARIRYVAFDAMPFYQKVMAGPKEGREYYEQHKDDFKTGETRQVKFLLFDMYKSMSEAGKSITDKQLAEELEGSRAKYPRMVRASHILVPFGDQATEQERASALQKAEAILAEVRAPGTDFALVAARESSDTGSGKQGGDVGFFTAEKMVPEFSEKAFSMNKGEISAPVRTRFGYHIIKVTETDDLPKYKPQIVMDIEKRMVTARLQARAEQAAARLQQKPDLEAAAKEFGAEVKLSKPINDAVGADQTLGKPEGLVQSLFQMKLNEVGRVFPNHMGFVIPQLVKIVPPGVQAYEDVAGEAINAYRDQEAHRLAKEEAKQFIDEAKKAGDFAKAAASKKLGVKNSNLFGRFGDIDDDIRYQPEIIGEVFKMKVDEIGGPSRFAYREFVFQVAERQIPDMSKLAAERANIRADLLNKKRGMIYGAILARLISEYKKENLIQINDKLVERMSG